METTDMLKWFPGVHYRIFPKNLIDCFHRYLLYGPQMGLPSGKPMNIGPTFGHVCFVVLVDDTVRGMDVCFEKI